MHDVKQFRENAERCERLARDATREDVRKLYAEIAARWRWLADTANAQPEESEQTEPKVGSPP